MMRLLFTTLMISVFCNSLLSQTDTTWNDSLLNSTFSNYELPVHQNRSVMTFKGRSFWYKINPFSYVSVGLMFTYQRVISQQLSSDCAYEMSCSEHAKRSVEKYGIMKGVFLGFYQFQSCIPSAQYDYPDHAINHEAKIINPIELGE